jgi:hypothetical protein
MFWLYICSHRQAGYRTFNKKTTKIQYNRIVVYRSPVGEPGGSFVYRGLGQTQKDCSLNGAYLSMGALSEEPEGRGGPLLGTVKARSYLYSETGSKTDLGP